MADPHAHLGETPPRGKVRVISRRLPDEELLERLQRRDVGAPVALYDHFAQDVNRMVWRQLGADSEHDDVVQQVFVAVLDGIDSVRDPKALRAWVLAVAVRTSCGEIRRRRLRRLFSSSAPAPEVAVAAADHEARDLLRRVYAILDRLAVAERAMFILRFVDDRPLAEIAQLCDCSLATVKRRIERARRKFTRRAEREPELARRMQQGSRWRAP